MVKFMLSLLLCWTSLLLACTPKLSGQALACEEIVNDPALSLNFDLLGRSQIIHWVKSQYGVEEADVFIYDSAWDPEYESLVWTSRGKDYTADFIGGTLRRMSVSHGEQISTGEEIHKCLGTPNSYLATIISHERSALTFEMWYPERGVVAQAIQMYDRDVEPSTVDEDIPVHFLYIVRPASVATMTQDVYLINSQEIRNRVIETLTSWPQEWRDIHIRTGSASSSAP